MCFGQYNILLHLINPANHSLALGMYLEWLINALYPTSPPLRWSDPVGPCTVHLYLLTIFFLHMYFMHIYMYILCAKLFAVYAWLHHQLRGGSDSLALRSSNGGLKRFCGYPNLPALSTSFPTGQLNTIGVVYKCAWMSNSSQYHFTLIVHKCTQVPL